MHVYDAFEDEGIEGPYGESTTAVEFVDVRDQAVTAWVGHGDARSSDAGHEADYGTGTSPTHEDDARWVDGSSAW